MGDVEVATEDDGPVLLQPIHVLEERWVPGLAHGDTGEVVFGIGSIDSRYIELLKLRNNDPPLLGGVAIAIRELILRDNVFGKAVDHGFRGMLGENSGARVAFFLS